VSCAAAPAEPAPRPPGPLVRGVHLAVLSALAVAQPLFELLGANAEFFAARRSPPADILVWAAGVVLVPPALGLLLEALAGLAGRRLAWALHLGLVGALTALLAVQALARLGLGATPALLAAAVLLGLGGALAYLRAAPVRSALTILAPAPLAFLALFLLASPAARLLGSGEAHAAARPLAARTPVVMVVLDELPTTSLMDRRGGIDAARYPGFSRLARESWWFRNATTVHDSTTKAMPAIVTGREPRPGQLPLASDHADTLFTFLGGSYVLRVSEDASHMCPRRLCPSTAREPAGLRLRSLASDSAAVYANIVSPPRLRDHLPNVSQGWRDFRGADRERTFERFVASLRNGRPARFDEWLRGIRAGARPSLDFVHVLLPHAPFQYLPSGRAYAEEGRVPGLHGARALPDPGVSEHLWQRHLLQVGMADRLVGRLLDRLERTGLDERALLVVVADHGVAFRPGEDRRAVTARNVADVAPVPLFVRLPGQERGRLSERWVRTVDVMPTIADVVGAPLGWRGNGRSAFARGPDRDEVSIPTREGRLVRLPAREFLRRRERSLRRRIALLGDGRDARGLHGIGPRAELHGRRVAELPRAPAGPARATLDEPEALARVDPSSGFVPVQVSGRIRGEPPRRRPLAVAVNGRVAATGTSFTVLGGERLSVMVPEASLRPGANRVELFELEREGAGTRLVPLGRPPR
jgi:hypothetical protein